MVDATPFEMIDAAKAGGFNAAGVRVHKGNPIPLALELVGKPALVRELRSHADGEGIAILDTEACALFGDTDVSVFDGALDVSAALGARFISATGCDPEPARLLENFVELCNKARARGITVAIEFLPYRQVRNVAEARALLEKARQPNAGMLIDALHLSRSGGSPDDVAALPPGMVTHLQLCDAQARIPSLDALPEEARYGRLYPGEGALWLDRLVDLMPEDMPIAFEVPVARTAALPVLERGRIAGEARRVFFERRASRAA